jgi:hypothetical protein
MGRAPPKEIAKPKPLPRKRRKKRSGEHSTGSTGVAPAADNKPAAGADGGILGGRRLL